MLRTLGGARVDGSDFGRPKPLLLLAYLTLEGPQLRSHLAELFWPGSPQGNRSLTTALVRLRRALPGRVHADELRVRSELRSDVQELRRDLADGDLDSALALYRGPFLDGLELPGWNAELEEWVYAEREALGEELRRALLRRALLQSGRGRLEGAAAWAERATTLPGAPPPEPGTLAQLHAMLRAADHPLAAKLEADAEAFDLKLPATSAAAREALEAQEDDGARHDLPARGGPFIGRELELTELQRALAAPERRLVTLVGPGGTGKTRLALQAAREALGSGFSHVHFVGLEAAEELGAATTLMAEALGVEPASAADPILRIIDTIGARRVLLVLDNLEQLPGAAGLVAALLEGCENLKVLATSRERLDLGAEWAVPLTGLSVPAAGCDDEEARLFDAVRLFALRAQQAAPDFELRTEDVKHVTRLCRLLEGAPLGLELAAALTRALSCREIADEAERTFDILARRSGGEAERHRSLRTAFTHSWRLLGPDEREMLARLAVFRGGFRRDEAAHVTEGSSATLLALADKSLVQRSGERWTLHPVTREYAQERLEADPGALRATRERHARSYLAMAEAGAEGLKGAEQGAWLARLAAERDNLRAALVWAREEREAALGLRLAISLQQFWWIRGPHDEGCEHLLALHDLPEAEPFPLLRATAMHRAGTLQQELGEHERARRGYEAALEQAEELGDAQLMADALHSLGLLADRLGREGSRALFERALALQRQLGDRWGVATSLNSMALAEARTGRLREARDLLLESLALKRSLGDTQGIAYALNNLGAVSMDLGETAAARAFAERSLELKRELGDVGGVANSLANLARVATLEGRIAQARQLLREATAALGTLEAGWTLVSTLAELVAAEARAGSHKQALRLAGGVEKLRRRMESDGRAPAFPELEEARRSASAAVGTQVAEQLLLEGGSLAAAELVALARRGGENAPGATVEAPGSHGYR